MATLRTFRSPPELKKKKKKKKKRPATIQWHLKPLSLCA
jgi:hypothetical protein